ncbi:LysM peptidoglycan-binding domain-containing protein [Bacillus sp. DTU_2020_1000418_1_SI_GHA_SEK_038]|uniref:LysM peptidoglycan-binding domain-containing protein n=1 Tax=Bacillus sp. DTU_2020_1000418_1_SI_GHA_SEK_038 TaxID=3077585 RepID=UPI0028E32F77|nr:LysM peptidoglycan-binding domain-containing protein [Bacillus sp. DTU_2020_1000418_1_SI_GHA_SEK_038]WNS75806.1 LysM peptidoglycan-binding domain-containing protein [Bacillus sp. DTU_2020_1000418_1_SI_GHA_SEK_038]
MNTISTKRKQRIAEMRKQRMKARNKKVAITTAAGAITAIILLNGKAEAYSSAYTVKPKDNLYNLSKKYQVSVEQLMEVNGLVSEKIIVGQRLLLPIQHTEEGSVSYTVQKGDTIYSLAKQYEISINDLKKKNNMNSDKIIAGEKLLLPLETHSDVESYYTVVAGDTLWGIAKRFGMTAKELAGANGLSKEMVLIGQKLNIPGSVQISKAEVVGAADSFTVEFTEQGKPLVLQVPYGTASDYQKKSSQKVHVIHKNGSVIQIY